MSRRLRERDELRFFLQWLRRPGQVGAVAPSGRALAAALAAGIDTGAPGAVIELGPGTGRVTKALLAAGIAPADLVAVERNASFCEMLRTRFPGVRIVRGEARSLERLLRREGVGPVRAVVSSLPLLNMLPAQRRAVLSAIAAVLGDDGVLVQYTYGQAAPVPRALCAELGLTGRRTGWVLANLPPAAVWCYRRAATAPGLSRAA